MKKQYLCFAAVWLCALTLLVGVTVMPRVRAASAAPTLFYNDTAWAMDDYYPSLGFVTGAMEDYWIPLSFFEEINGIRVRRGPSKTITSFVIQDTLTGKYLSFNLADSNYAQTERGTLLLVNTTLYSKERYLPMRDLCAYFGWSFEMSEDRRSVRICDGGQRLDFAELLAIYDPPPLETDTDDTPIGEQTGTGDGAGEVLYRAAVLYLTFEDIDGTHTPAILDTLAEYKVPATFFVTGEQLSSYPELVVRILTEGHALGLHGMTGAEDEVLTTDGMLDAFARENELLYALTHRKTRLIRLPEGSHSGKIYLSTRQKQALSDAGYVLWDWNIAAMDHEDYYTADAVQEKVETALKTIYYPVVRFHCTETAAEVLPALLERLSMSQTTAKKITEATAPVVFP
ncbi:MAG: polysaccharide deacetylase family protein [Clostridia bacterium]|nr:polysaccharide deacetylase family protein [Clostridia bacterium]